MIIYQVDAFAEELFKGNPAAVCPLEEWLPENVMQNIAMENNLAETAFIVKEKDHYHIRWFTPTVEVDLCGHATLASAFVLFNDQGFNDDMIRFKSKSGELRVLRDGEVITLDFPANTPVPVTDIPGGLFQGLKITNGKVFKAAWDYMVVLETQDEIERLDPDFLTLGKVESRGVIVTSKGNKTDFVSRCFYPQSGINEDPVTGSAHTVTTPYWSEILGKKKLTALQLSKRGGRLLCELKDDRVFISGKAKLYLKGEYFLQ